MKAIRNLWRHRLAKFWLCAAIVGLLVLNVGANGDLRPEQWEYKTLWFQVKRGDNLDDLQRLFTAAMNREAGEGWEFAGRCAHSDSPAGGIDFVVLKRPR
ncbi:MAG TPA: hypothetical protein VMY42_05175 [Thermoguttaceae bacterium]|nr:hypothetical protein [Thermoguttaceae bacterium]